jgi:hypothetical protein
MPGKRLSRRRNEVRIEENLLYSDVRVADYLNISPRTLQSWRRIGKGPSFVKLGRTVRYQGSSVLEYVRAGLRNV